MAATNSRGRDLFVMALLAALPFLAHAPAWWEGQLLGPGDAAALHYPLKAAVWEAYRRGELPSWNPTIFLGTPLLASYRPGALFPPVAALSLLPSFAAFQVLVLFSLASAGVLLFLYVRRLGATRVGAYFAGVSFPLGPYLVGHLDDTATVVAAPTLPLLLLAAEGYLGRDTPRSAVGLAGALALLLLAGSPEAARAGGALLAGRLLVAFLSPAGGRRPDPRRTLLALLAGVLLAAPQIVPTLIAAREAGRSVTGLAGGAEAALPGATGLVLRYASHTPSASLALAALPLALVQTPIRVLGIALIISLVLQWGRGPLAAPGALALVFDITLCILAGLSLSAQWRARREELGRRLRAYFLSACLASAAALSVAAAALGPLPETLAGAVGVLALALILYFPNASSPDPVRAGMWLLPLTVSFLLQPHGRRAWDGAPTREDLDRGTGTREAIDRAMGLRRAEPNIALVREWPKSVAADLAYANLGALAGRRSANGYDPMVSQRTRTALGAMSVGGTLPDAFFRTDPARLEWLGIRWVQLPVSALQAAPGPWGWGDALDLTVEEGHPRFFPLPITPVTEVRVISSLSGGTEVGQEEVVAFIHARLASGRDFSFPVRAGIETADSSHDRPGAQARHWRAPIAESWRAPEGTFLGHSYQGALTLPGRYYVDGLRVERLAGRGRFALSRLAVFDAQTGRLTPVSLPAAYVSDTGRFREAAATPEVRLFEVPGTLGPAWVVERVRVLANEEAVQESLRFSGKTALDPRREALLAARDARKIVLPAHWRSSRAEVVRVVGGRVEVRAQGPGLLVVAAGWDPGWRATLDGWPAAVVRTNHVQMGVALPPGAHRIVLRHCPRGLLLGAVLAAVAAAGLGIATIRTPRA